MFFPLRGDRVKRWLGRSFTRIVFALSLLVLGFALGQFYLQKAYQQQMEAGYRRALREFAVHLTALAQELGKARLVSAPEQTAVMAANMRSSIEAAQANLGQLPLGEVDLGRIEQIMWECYRSSYAYGQGSLSSEALQAFYEQISQLSGEVQNLLADKELESSWVSWSRYFTTSLTFSESITTALSNINASLDELDGNLVGLPRIAKGSISGDEISKEQAVQTAREFSGRDGWEFQVVNEREGDIPAFTVEGRGAGQETITLEVSRQGGLVLWMISSQTVSESNLSENQMADSARRFLAERGFPEVHVTDLQVLHNRATFTFVPVVGGLLRYAEPIKVQVSASDGQILGFQGVLYYLARGRAAAEEQGTENAPPQVALEPKKLEELINPQAVVLDHKLALVPNELDEEVLTHRLGVKLGEDYYLVYINDKSGQEERIVPVSSPDFF